MRTVPVQVVCRSCGNAFRTTVRGGNTRCRQCGTSRYVRTAQEWEGPADTMPAAADRAAAVNRLAPVWVACRCGHDWQSRARDHVTIRCPSCRTACRVPRRRWENTQAQPRAIPPTFAASPPPPARRREPDRPPAPPAPRFTAPAAPVAGGGLLELLRSLAASGPRRPASPSPTPPPLVRSAAPRRPAPPSPAPAAAGPNGTVLAHLAAIARDPQRDERRRQSMCALVGGMDRQLMVWFDQPRGSCEVLDIALRPEERRCPAAVEFAVVTQTAMYGITYANACRAHARQLAEHIGRFNIPARLYPTKRV